jgi:hypothetical protein
MMNYDLDSAAAMRTSFKFAQSHADGMQIIEKRFLERQNADINNQTSLKWEVFIKGCKDVAMGLVHWR